MKRLLWLGSYLTDELAKEHAQLGYRNAASVVSQKNLLEGLEKNIGQRFSAISLLSTHGTLKKKRIHIEERTFSHAEGVQDLQVGYLNIRYFNRLTGEIGLRKAVKRWMSGIDRKQDELDVFIYEMRSACLAAAKDIKRLMPSARVHLIVPDLPQFMDLHMSRVKKWLKEMDWRIIRKRMKYVDDFILYSEPMAKYLGIPDGKWMVMEGSINIGEVGTCPTDEVEQEHGKTVVMYSGNVNEQYGIMHLVRAFEHLDDGYELWITGGGNAVGQVKAYAAKDARIKYYGFLPTRADLLALQRKASMFINMRDPNEQSSAYCFPSKLFEYMTSGKPVLSCRLDGIPEEYFQYLIEMKEFDPAGIAEGIRKVGAMTLQERTMLGQRQFAFIAENKNNVEQTKQICRFLRGGIND
ncbi:MAG: glycosyltransferase [Clostridia bacterium]|nr:glycosyltransferase [Clostridia bacterium]